MLSNKKITSYAAPLDLLANRVILVTGAGDGIGRAVARACAAHGATVLLAGRTIAKLEDTYDAIAAAGGCDAIICPIDIEGATSDDFQQFNADIESQFGRLDGLVNNAGILGQRTPLNHYKTNVWERVIKTNVSAQFELTQALMPSLQASSTGASIIFTSSGVGRKGRAFWGAYAVSKFAVEGLVQTWAAEVEGMGALRINAINPGATRTQMRATAYPAENPETLKTAADITPTYLYLLGDASLGINGQSLDAQLAKK